MIFPTTTYSAIYNGLIIPLAEQMMPILASHIGQFSKVAVGCIIITFRCSWNLKDCDKNAFRPVLTDLGVCYTFNGDQISPRQTTVTGMY